MKFSFHRLSLAGLVQIDHELAADDRGFFVESFRENAFGEGGVPARFVQENHSRSQKGVLRGLHYQLNPKAQGKLVRCVRGKVFDVVVDLRQGSPTFGKWLSVELSDENKRMLYVPPGFAHGFQAVSDWADVIYKQTEYYSPEHERGIIWNAPELAIPWPILEPKLSAKDKIYPSFKDAEHNFDLPRTPGAR